jgi:hypothetical protein
MAMDLEKVAIRLQDEGYPLGGKLVADLARSLRQSCLIPVRLRDADDFQWVDKIKYERVLLDVERVRTLRLERHLSQRTLALLARLSPAYLNVLETHARAPLKSVLWSTAELLARALGVEVAALVAELEDQERWVRAGRPRSMHADHS